MTEIRAFGQSQEFQRRSKDLEADLAISVDRAMTLEKLVTDLKDELASGNRYDSTKFCLCVSACARLASGMFLVVHSGCGCEYGCAQTY